MVTIESHPADGGSAAKSISADGIASGNHSSGSPDALMISISESTATPDDMEKLKSLVAELKAFNLQEKPVSPDQKTKGYKSVRISLQNDENLTVHAEWEQPFSPLPAQKIWDLVYGYDVGYW
ncbi:MAG: hypothetical protein JXR40_14630 [Pontiellaceae bacterium]|nr:hypothetical protein [Pontiellaceae bacterium]